MVDRSRSCRMIIDSKPETKLLTLPGECVTLMIRSIWTKYEDLPNSMPANNGTNTRDYVSFFLFWLCSLPAIWFPVHQIRHLFTVKAFFVPVAGVTYFIWAIVRAHGIGPIVHQGSSKHGSALGWAFVSGIMSSIANFATLIVNDPGGSKKTLTLLMHTHLIMI